MTLPERIFALRSLPPLASLDDVELAVIAEAVKERSFPPGALVCQAGRVPARLLFVCKGAVLDDSGCDQGSVAGATALLFNQPVSRTWTSSPDQGAFCLQLARSHLFTMIRQCPAFVVGLLTDHSGAPSNP
jgi:signal-transduction protein with cAMP-binding, CBS, and nucleotidyltransferase domain